MSASDRLKGLFVVIIAQRHLWPFLRQFVRDAGVLRSAVWKVTDQDLLAEIAKTDCHESIRGIAVGKLTDQALLADIAKTADDVYVRRRAVWNRHLRDQGLLADIAKTANDASVRAGAVANLTDQALLAEIAKTDGDPDVRRSAVDKLTNQALVRDVAQTDGDAGVREAAIENVRPLPAGLKWHSGGCWSYGAIDGNDALREFDKIKTVILAFKRKNDSARHSEVEISVWNASRNVQFHYQLLVTSNRYAPAQHGIGPDEELMNEVERSLESTSYDSCTPASYEQYVTMCAAEMIRYAKV